MKYILLVTAFLVAGIGVHARDIFVNGKFVTDRLGKPLPYQLANTTQAHLKVKP